MQPLEIAKNDSKIVYVAPMKPLAAEIVEKMGWRLSWLGIQVRELYWRHFSLALCIFAWNLGLNSLSR